MLRQTWPRIPAHAKALWDHLAAEHEAAEALEEMPHQPAEDNSSNGLCEQHGVHSNTEGTEEDIQMPSMRRQDRSESRQELTQAIAEAAEVIWWAGGEVFREHLQQAPSKASKARLHKVSSTKHVARDRV